MTQAEAERGIFGASGVQDGDGLVFKREPFTPWVIEIPPDHANRPGLYAGTYRTAFAQGRECEQFTLVLEEIDYALIQVQIFKNGDVTFWAAVPCNVQVKRRTKTIVVQLLCRVEVDHEAHAVSVEWLTDDELSDLSG